MSFTRCKEQMTMAATQLVQTRIEGAIKAEAASVLAAMGLTVSDALRLLLPEGGGAEQGTALRAADSECDDDPGDEGRPRRQGHEDRQPQRPVRQTRCGHLNTL